MKISINKNTVHLQQGSRNLHVNCENTLSALRMAVKVSNMIKEHGEQVIDKLFDSAEKVASYNMN